MSFISVLIGITLVTMLAVGGILFLLLVSEFTTLRTLLRKKRDAEVAEMVERAERRKIIDLPITPHFADEEIPTEKNLLGTGAVDVATTYAMSADQIRELVKRSRS